jgi:hypothetical protein
MIIDLSNLERIFDSGVIPNNQGYDHTRIVRFPDDSASTAMRGKKLRTKIHHDQSYAFQARYAVEVWDGAWVEVCTWPGDNGEFSLPKHFYGAVAPAVETAVASVVTHMQSAAIRVLS